MAIAFINGTTGEGGGDTTVTATAISHTAGNLLVVLVGNETAGPVHVASIADTAGNTYAYCNHGHNGNDSCEVWYAKNIAGNANNIVEATFAANANYQKIIVLQYSGANQTAPYDVSNVGTSLTNFVETAASNTTEDNEVLVAGVYVANNVTFTAGANYTKRNELTYFASEDWLGAAAGSHTGSFTLGGSTASVCVFASFKMLAAGGYAESIAGTLSQLGAIGRKYMGDRLLTGEF